MHESRSENCPSQIRDERSITVVAFSLLPVEEKGTKCREIFVIARRKIYAPMETDFSQWKSRNNGTTMLRVARLDDHIVNFRYRVPEGFRREIASRASTMTLLLLLLHQSWPRIKNKSQRFLSRFLRMHFNEDLVSNGEPFCAKLPIVNIDVYSRIFTKKILLPNCGIF